MGGGVAQVGHCKGCRIEASLVARDVPEDEREGRMRLKGAMWPGPDGL